MSKEHSTQLWNAVQDSKFRLRLIRSLLLTCHSDDFHAYDKINSILLNPATPLKHIPLRVYIPSSPSDSSTLGSVRTWQSLVAPRTPDREVQTLGSALKSIFPELFTSTRDPVYAEGILHGAPVPLKAPLEEVMREAAFADGWIHLSLRMMA